MNRRTFIQTGTAATGALLIVKDGFAAGDPASVPSLMTIRCGPSSATPTRSRRRARGSGSTISSSTASRGVGR